MMYDFSFFDMNLFVAGVLLAMTAHMISATPDDIPIQQRDYTSQGRISNIFAYKQSTRQ